MSSLRPGIAVPLLLGVIVLSATVGYYSRKAKLASHTDQQVVEEGAQPSNAYDFYHDNHKHIMLFFDIIKGELVPSSRPAQVRPGNMPYPSVATGSPMVIYKGADGEELGHYPIDYAVLARSHDFDAGKAVGDTKPDERGTAVVLLPYDPKITTLEIMGPEGKVKTFDIRPEIKRIIGTQEQDVWDAR